VISVISAVKNQSKQKFAMARTPSPARETRALPRIPLNNGTGRLVFEQDVNVVSDRGFAICD